jgi:hypothetical protein
MAERCRICGREVKGSSYAFDIGHINCTFNLRTCNTAKEFAELILSDVKTYNDIELMKVNLACTEKYLLQKGRDDIFIKKVRSICEKYIKGLKDKGETEKAIGKIVNILVDFSENEREKILKEIDLHFWNGTWKYFTKNNKGGRV